MADRDGETVTFVVGGKQPDCSAAWPPQKTGKPVTQAVSSEVGKDRP